MDLLRLIFVIGLFFFSFYQLIFEGNIFESLVIMGIAIIIVDKWG